MTDLLRQDRGPSNCQRTQVAILGAGVAGITAAQTLTNNSVPDFIIVEHNDYIGGRVVSKEFGQKPDGSLYVVELGANWLHGPGQVGGRENPIWSLIKKYGLENSISDYSSMTTYDEQGEADFTELFDQFDEAYENAGRQAGEIIINNLQDTHARAGLAMAGWKPKGDMHRKAVEWFNWDWDTNFPPEQSSFAFGVAVSNLTFNQFGEENRFVTDQRGYNSIIKGEASEFLKENDPRLMLETTVTNITYSNDGVTINLDNDECIEADYAICTFSIGVLQNDVVTFDPPLPVWKREAIEMFQLGTYTKVFFQFNETFWNPDMQYLLYADPESRGHWPLWQPLTPFMKESNILIATLVGEDAHHIENQTDEETMAQAMVVLRKMFPDRLVPDPISIMYPKWSHEEWSFGSFSNWPVGMTLERHQNLRANVQKLWFAGEATSAQYFGFLHGAWFEGQEVGSRIAGLIKRRDGERMARYEVLHGTTFLDEYNAENGWPVSSFKS